MHLLNRVRSLPFVSLPLIYCVIEGKATSCCLSSPLFSQKTAPFGNAGVRVLLHFFSPFHSWENNRNYSRILQMKWLVRKPFGKISNLCDPQNIIAFSDIALDSGGHNCQMSSSMDTVFRNCCKDLRSGSQ